MAASHRIALHDSFPIADAEAVDKFFISFRNNRNANPFAAGNKLPVMTLQARNAEFAHSLYFFAALSGIMHKIRNNEKIPYSVFRIPACICVPKIKFMQINVRGRVLTGLYKLHYALIFALAMLPITDFST